MLAGLMVPAFFASNFLIYFIVLYSIILRSVIDYIQEGFSMKVTTSKSKNSESFYIAKSYINNKGKSTSVNVRKLGTLKELLIEHGPTRDDVMRWAKEEARLETLKYKKEQQTKAVPITFHSDQKLDYDQQVLYRGGYLFPQSFYYRLQLDKTCRKLRDKYKFKYDINSILSDLIYARILEPDSKRSSYKTASEFLEKPSYQLHDLYRSLDVLGNECDFIQSEVYKNSHLLGKRNDKILYYDCTNYYFEIEQEDGDKKYGKSKEHRPNPIIRMGMFMDGDGIPLAFSLFPGNANEQTSLKPLETKVLQDFCCTKFIYCSDAGLGSEAIKRINHVGFSLELSVSIRLLFTILQGFSTSFFFLEIFKSIIAANVPITANTIIKRKIARYPAAPSYASRSLPHIGLIKTSGVNPIKETMPIAVPVTCRGIFASSIVAK